jgi:signal transduction histidine kinase/CheY-like chemotaxis protein
MSDLHPRLERALRNVGASGGSTSLEPRALRDLLQAVSRAFYDADSERSARERRDEELQAATRELEAAREERRTRGEWLAGLGPGLRSPLTELAEHVDLLLEGELAPHSRDRVEGTRESLGSVLAALDDILDFSEMEAGTLEIDPIPFDLRPAVEEVASALAPLAEERGLELVVRYDPGAPRHVVGDPGRIRQALFNLLRHAVTATREGWVLIDVAGVSWTEEEVVMRFAVEDSGQGIAHRELRRLYETSGRTGGVLPDLGGAALGLAVAGRLVGRMGGSTGTEHDAGLTSSLWFELPLPLDRQAPPELQAEDLTDVRIMVVDASEARRVALEDQLGHWEMRCESFVSGAEALRELRRAKDEADPFRIVILSTRIEGMDAELFGDLVKSDAALKDVDLVLLTALGEKGAGKRLREIGFSAYLVKPIQEAPLKETLQCVWGARKHGDGQALVTRHTLSESGILELTPSAREPASSRRR